MTGTDLNRAVNLLRAGDVVAIPTETVYGLAGSIYSERALKKIFKVKNRPFSDPLIVHVPDAEAIWPLVLEFPPIALSLIDAFSPGPLTLLLPKSEKVPDLVTNGSPWVAIRIPDHPLTLELLIRLGLPLAAPSANPFGGISPTQAIHVEKGLGNSIPYILDGGPCQVGVESTIVRIGKDGRLEILRQGGIPEEDLRLFGELESQNESLGKISVPGSLLSHYAPKKPVYLEGQQPEELEKNHTLLYLRFQHLLPNIPAHRQLCLSPEGNLTEAARNLFDGLHKLDSAEGSGIVAECFPQKGLGKAIQDRLNRASAKRP
jgi:L-threonylcarbamoyladenylate synthase